MEILGEMMGTAVIIQIALGLLNCFFGYKIFKFILGVFGFFVGASLAASFVSVSSGGSQTTALIAAVIGGIIGAVLMVALYFVGIFLFGAGLGYIVGMHLTANLNINPEPTILIVLAVIGGILALIAQKFMIIISTAFMGSWAVISGIFYFIKGDYYPVISFQDPDVFKFLGEQSHLMLALWIGLGIIGVLVQYAFFAEKKIKSETRF